MTKKEFQDGMDTIQVDGEIKEQLWDRLCEQQLQRTERISGKAYISGNQGEELYRQKSFLRGAWTPVAAALLLCVILIPGIVYADEIVNYFQGHLSRNPKLASNVEQNVFQDGDEHVSMEVCELLSDGYAACMTVKYTALDKEGREWLFSDIFQDVPPMYRESLHSFNLDDVLCIAPIGKESKDDILQNGYYKTKEIEEERTKKSRMFSLEYGSNDTGSNHLLLRYPLIGASREKALTAKNILKTYIYALDGDGECNRVHFTPQYLRISAISYAVYGEEKGLYQNYDQDHMFVTERTSNEDVTSAILHFKNRSSFDLLENDPNSSGMGFVSASDATCNMDFCLLRGSFYDQPAWIPFEDRENWYGRGDLEERIDHRLAIDPEDVQKLEINGDMYTLNRVD